MLRKANFSFTLCGCTKIFIDDCFVRLVRILFGKSAISDKKLETGNPLIVLGIEISLSASGANFRPAVDKKLKWSAKMRSALDEGKLCSGEASKLSGALQWAAQHLFRRLGRAMIRPIIKQAYSSSSKLSKELIWALKWWLEVLEMDIVEQRQWSDSTSPPVHLFCDARSTPPRVAAVMFRYHYLYRLHVCIATCILLQGR